MKTARFSKIMAAALAILMTLSTVFSASAEDAFTLLYRTADGPAGEFAYVTGYTGTLPNELIIPEQLGGCDVSGIEIGAFAQSDALESVALPDSVNGIGRAAFADCPNLKSVQINEVYYIGLSAFENCKSLTEFHANGCNTICERAFAGCTALETLYTDACIIEKNAFLGCYRLNRVVLTGYRSNGMMADWAEEGNDTLFLSKMDDVHYPDELMGYLIIKNAYVNDRLPLSVDYDEMKDTDRCAWYLENYGDDVTYIKDSDTKTCTVVCLEPRTEYIVGEVINADGDVVYQVNYTVRVRYSLWQRMTQLWENSLLYRILSIVFGWIFR